MTDADEVKPNKKPVHIDRVNLTAKAFQKLGQWTEQVKESLKGAELSRHNLASWLIESQDDVLSNRDIAEIKKRFYNEESLIRWAVREQKEAQKRGESISIVDLIKSQAVNFKNTPKAPRKPKATPQIGQVDIPKTELKPTKFVKNELK